MTWNILPTYTDGDALTAAMLEGIKGNINETAPAKATTAGWHFVSNGVNTIVERAIQSAKITTQQTTGSTTYANLATNGPVVTVNTGAQALVFFGCQMFNDGAGACWSSYEIFGATSNSPEDNRAITAEANANDSFRMGVTELQPVTPGNNTFHQKYRVSSGTGTFDDRYVIVMAL